jgi:hypothetical protein
MTALFDRDPDGSSILNARGRALGGSLDLLLGNFLRNAEAEDGPVDLRDLMVVIQDSGENVCAIEIIMRRVRLLKAHKATRQTERTQT